MMWRLLQGVTVLVSWGLLTLAIALMAGCAAEPCRPTVAGMDEPRRFGQTSDGKPWREVGNGLVVITDPMTGNTTTIRR